MTQREVAEIIGVIAHHQVSNHERSGAIPSLLAALSYQVVFSVSAAELFPGLYETIRLNVEARLAELEDRLRESTAKGRKGQVIARKLEWLCERKKLATV
jgi:transcriptional regulator with XRE-family HTH domain